MSDSYKRLGEDLPKPAGGAGAFAAEQAFIVTATFFKEIDPLLGLLLSFCDFGGFFV